MITVCEGNLYFFVLSPERWDIEQYHTNNDKDTNNTPNNGDRLLVFLVENHLGSIANISFFANAGCCRYLIFWFSPHTSYFLLCTSLLYLPYA